MKSRLWTRGIGAQVFTNPASSSTPPPCPAGFHWEADETPIRGLRGLSACVPDKVATLRIPPRVPIMPTTAPAPLPPLAPAVIPTSAAAPTAPSGDAAAAPEPTAPPASTCPAPWPWWWLLVAAGVGGVAGTYAAKEQKKKTRAAAGI